MGGGLCPNDENFDCCAMILFVKAIKILMRPDEVHSNNYLYDDL